MFVLILSVEGFFLNIHVQLFSGARSLHYLTLMLIFPTLRDLGHCNRVIVKLVKDLPGSRHTRMLQCNCDCEFTIDWLQSLKQLLINVPYHIRVASLTLMALF